MALSLSSQAPVGNQTSSQFYVEMMQMFPLLELVVEESQFPKRPVT
jgi:hypothetical protein